MNKITKTNYYSSFSLVGTPKMNDNTFKIDEVSESGWQYNQLNLALDCGEKHGFVYSSLMGGFSTTRDNVIYVHGKNDEGKDDFKNLFTVPWEDRFNEEILDTIGDACFVEVGLEVTNENNLFTKRFLSAYDAIAYVNEHLTSDMNIRVQGNLRYSLYNGRTSMQKDITSIKLSRQEPTATFTQSVLLDTDSVNPKEDVDKEAGRILVHGIVLDYIKEINGVEIKSQYPLHYDFYMDFDDAEKFKLIYKYYFDIKGDSITQVNFEGEFLSSGATIQATMDDVSDDMKAQIKMGLFTEEEVLTLYATSGPSERRCVLMRPRVPKDTKEPQVYPDRYKASDLDVFNDVQIPTAEPIVEDDFDIDDLF